MKKTLIIGLCCAASLLSWSQTDNKAAAIASIEAQQTQLIEMSDYIWEQAEVAFEESNSADVLVKYAQEQGFRIATGGAEMPTGFTA